MSAKRQQRKSMPNLSSLPWRRGAPRGRFVTRNLVLAAEFIPQGRVADQDDMIIAAACDPRILGRGLG